MIRNRINGDAFDAAEDMLLVPVPIDAHEINEGFAGQVLNRFEGSRELLRAKAGLAAGEFLLQGTLAGDPNWRPRYSLLFAGIHHRREHGWELADKLLEGVLDRVQRTYKPNWVATAGMPGTGFSGLRGDAMPYLMERVFQESV